MNLASVVNAVLRSSAVRRPREVELHGDGRQSAEKVKGAVEGVGPRPLERSSQCRSAGATDEAPGDGQEPGAHGAGHGEVILRGDVAEHGCPADEVVGESGAQEPRRVGEEVPRGDVFETCTLLQITDAEFHGGMGPVELVDLHRCPAQVGEEGEVTPLGPQRGLATGEPGASHDETSALVDAFGHLGLAVEGVVDRCPGRLLDGLDGPGHGRDHADTHGVADVQALQGGQGGVGPEARIEAQDQFSGGPGPAHPGHELLHEALGPALGVGRPLAHADVEDLARPRPHGDQGVVAEHLGVAIAGSVLGLAAYLADGGVEVDDELVGPRSRSECPGPAQRLAQHPVQLTDVAEGE